MIPIEFATIRAKDITAVGSRYRQSDVLYYGEQKFVTFTTYKRVAYKPNGQERVMMITKGVEFRPDLVSFDMYGFPDAWWRILEANGMRDVFDFKAGRTILLPQDVF